ncbi:MAG: SDR family oxidoreductase [Planctomycetota bacterium]
MPKLLDGKVVVVTGASQGLGKATAEALAVDGASVFLVARREAELQQVADEAGKHGEAEIFAGDITDRSVAPQIMAACKERFGKIDALVNCAGVFVWQKFFDLSPDDWDRTIATNLSAPFFLTQEAGRAMVDQGRGGAIVNIASIHGSLGDPSVVPHCASKFGLVGLTKASAEALRDYDVRVNAISPGAIDPDSGHRRSQSLKEKVTQADIATLTVFLVSHLALSITGSVFDMHGSTRAAIKG